MLGGVPATVRLVLRRHATRRHRHHHKQHQHYHSSDHHNNQYQYRQQHGTNQRHNNLRDAVVGDPHPSARIRSLCLLDDDSNDDSYGPCPPVVVYAMDDRSRASSSSGDDHVVVDEGEYQDDDNDGSNDEDANHEDDHNNSNDEEEDDDGVETAAYHHHKCKPRQNWHQHPHPNCNTFYEEWDSVENLRKIDEGYTTAVYEMLNHAHSTAVDTTPPDADWHRATGSGNEIRGSDRYVFKVNLLRDTFEHNAKREEATLLERLSRSPYIPKIYGFCGTSTLNPYAASGTLYDLIKSIRRGGDDYLEGHVDALRIGVQVAEGLAALHDADGTGHPTFAQNDLDVSQYIYDEKMQTFQLGDLNDGYFVLYDENDKPCKAATSRMGPWKYRSPEDLTALLRNGPPFHLFTSDVFSLGGVLFMILTKQWLWEGDEESREVGTDRIIRGELPPIPEEFSGGKQDEATEALLRAIYSLCWVYDPDKRASAQDVATYLKEKLESIRPGEVSGGGGRSPSVVRVNLPPILSNVLELDDDYDSNM